MPLTPPQQKERLEKAYALVLELNDVMSDPDLDELFLDDDGNQQHTSLRETLSSAASAVAALLKEFQKRQTKNRFRKYIKVDEKGCWLWTGFIEKRGSAAGYGRFQVKTGKCEWAHRVAYVLFKGAIPTGRVIDHLCRTRACVNPAHLEAVTRRQNTLRGVGTSAVNARKTHCPAGHPYDETNTARGRTKGDRRCRICQNEQSKLRNRRYRAAARGGRNPPDRQKHPVP